MNREPFFEKFALFADTPAAIGKMRELILNLAVRGKLDCSLTAENWKSTSLGLVTSTITKGATPTTYGFSYQDRGVPFVKVENVKDGRICTQTISQYISLDAHEYLARSKLQAGDVLFSIAGTIGKTCVVSEEDVPANTNQAFAIVRGYEGNIDKNYLKFQLDSFVSNAVKQRARGGAMPNVSLADLKQLEVLIPPLAEQKRIVARVDQLMALCDELESSLKTRDEKHVALSKAALARFSSDPTPTNLELLFHPSFAISASDLRKTILTLAVQGKLVRQKNVEGSANDLVHNSILKIEQSWPKIPVQWIWVRVDETGRVDLGRQRAPQHHTGPNMRPYLRVQNVYENRIDISDVKEMNFSPAEFETFALKPGDILLNEGQSFAWVGRPAIYRGEVPNACFQNTLVRYRGFPFIVSEYALVVFRTYLHNGKFQKISKQTTNIAHLSAGRFAALEFPLPPFAEQERIVVRVDELMALIDELEEKQKKAEDVAVKLIEAAVGEVGA